MGNQAAAEQVEISWPSGERDVWNNMPVNATYTLEEGGKTLSTRPYKR
jgi:hypothetical protein